VDRTPISPDQHPPALAHGVAVFDEATGRYGTVADATLSRDLVHLRPIGGGIEWRARREHIRPALASELLAARLRTARTPPRGRDGL
jgi:hypothetical protein